MIPYLNSKMFKVLVDQIWLPLINWKQPFLTFSQQEEVQQQQQQSDM